MILERENGFPEDIELMINKIGYIEIIGFGEKKGAAAPKAGAKAAPKTQAPLALKPAAEPASK